MLLIVIYFSVQTFYFCGVILDVDKYIFLWQTHFIWGVILKSSCSPVNTAVPSVLRGSQCLHHPGQDGFLDFLTLKIKALLRSFKTLGPTCTVTQCHNSDS